MKANTIQARLKHKGPILSVSAKCSDLYSHTIYNSDGSIYREYDGYVPSFFPDEHFGDYLMLDIDPYTGKILNWKPWKRAKKSKKGKGKK